MGYNSGLKGLNSFTFLIGVDILYLGLMANHLLYFLFKLVQFG
jgi:hypothetical protein